MKLKWVLLLMIVVAAGAFYVQERSSEDPEFINSTVSDSGTAVAGTLNAVGLHDAAVIWVDTVTPLAPADTELLRQKGSALTALGNYEEASACYDLLIIENTSDATALAGKAIAAYRLGDMNTSYACALDAIAIDPSDLGALERAGAASIGLGRYEEAVEYYDQIVTISPGDTDAWIQKGDALLSISILMEQEMKTMYSDLGKEGVTVGILDIDPYMEAMECYNRAISLDPKVAPMLASRMLARSQMTINTCQEILENL
ncbi:tetratricopeptide repeat protein [Methanofollis fontis]|uniref:Tetratricopeptide repeat protein n=1 Tax=Methanofollis fontis TaxID=2052832 RepID=A0A483CYG5_9EURY|nr:tetratricopeptide repeat protein [Methanofollis fontis]TAJ44686.1 hypothetical protein CUJ86_05120 [Methanofollis fontis]